MWKKQVEKKRLQILDSRKRKAKPCRRIWSGLIAWKNERSERFVAVRAIFCSFFRRRRLVDDSLSLGRNSVSRLDACASLSNHDLYGGHSSEKGAIFVMRRNIASSDLHRSRYIYFVVVLFRRENTRSCRFMYPRRATIEEASKQETEWTIVSIWDDVSVSKIASAFPRIESHVLVLYLQTVIVDGIWECW